MPVRNPPPTANIGKRQTNITLLAAMKIAVERKSSVLASNAVHHRIDSLTSIVALCAIGGSHLLNHAAWLDPVGGLLVSAMVVNAGYGNTRIALLELADVGLDREVRDSVKDVLSNAGINGVTEVSGVKSGQNYLVEVTVEQSSSATLAELAGFEDRIREVLGSPEGRAKVRGVKRVKVRFVQSGAGLGPSEFLEVAAAAPGDEVKEVVMKENGHTHSHDHGHEHSHEDKKGL